MSFIYLIQVFPDGPIKIGRSRSPKDRLIQLQAANPSELRLIAAWDGHHLDERALHQQFTDLRIRGEWFHPGENLLELAKAMGVPKPLYILPIQKNT